MPSASETSTHGPAPGANPSPGTPLHEAAARPPLLIRVQDGPAPAWLDRLASGMTFGLGAFFVWLLALVPPDPRGHGTHEMLPLGLQPCSWPILYEIPCPTCGVTTSATHLVHLQPVDAFVTQPFGATLALAGILVALLAGTCLLTGRSFLEFVGRLPYGSIVRWGIVLLLASWLYKYWTFTP